MMMMMITIIIKELDYIQVECFPLCMCEPVCASILIAIIVT